MNTKQNLKKRLIAGAYLISFAYGDDIQIFEKDDCLFAKSVNNLSEYFLGIDKNYNYFCKDVKTGAITRIAPSFKFLQKLDNYLIFGK